EYTVYGSAEGLTVPAVVKAYGRYVNDKGALLGYASRVWHEYVDGDEAVAEPVAVMVCTGKEYDPGDMIGYYPQLADGVVTTDVSLITEPEYTVVISGTKVDGVSGYAEAYLSGESPDAYTVNVSAVVANTAEASSSARVIVVRYDGEGKVISFATGSAALNPAMTGRETLTISTDYNRTEGEDIRIYLWDFGQLRPIDGTILVSELEEPRKYSDEILALIPEYDEVKENVERANSYRQSTWGPTDWVNGIHPAFWDTAAYHTGNMEAYFTFGNEEYKQYSTDWANNNSWSGNTYSGSKSNWRWGYNQSQGSEYVLFGDWQICFQTYLDLNLLDPDETKIARTKEVIDYQITVDPAANTKGDMPGFWWWADSLYMVPPIMTKLYQTTGNEGYLDALYEYYRYAAELMYDGELGIPNEGEAYTTAAALKSGASYSDPDNYAHLFYRDSNYVAPLNNINGIKNFWARGNGWVFAGLSKILADMPTDYEHYNFFLTIYTEMARAIIDCQHVDSDGNGFWTQSMLADYPKGNNGNTEGYETSGTAFMTYGLFWGLNSGILDEDTYLEPALRGWRYLSKVALLDDGRVGYCQPIGSAAT
ncbi:MAG: glycoside hydrolase family 88 protein, partial [Clostridia bacterium]